MKPMQRIPSQEWLDDDRGTTEEIRESLDDLWRIKLALSVYVIDARIAFDTLAAAQATIVFDGVEL